MNQLFITDLMIEKVRHLKDIHIPLAEDRIKHLIFTGKMEAENKRSGRGGRFSEFNFDNE